MGKRRKQPAPDPTEEVVYNLPSKEELIATIFRAARMSQEAGASIKAHLKSIADLPNPGALLRCMTAADKQWLLRAIRSTKIRTKHHAQRLTEIATAIEQEIKST